MTHRSSISTEWHTASRASAPTLDEKQASDWHSRQSIRTEPRVSSPDYWITVRELTVSVLPTGDRAGTKGQYALYALSLPV